MVSLNNNTNLWGRNPSQRQALVQELVEKLGVIVTRKQVVSYLQSVGRTHDETQWLFNNRTFRAGRGVYTLQPLLADSDNTTVSQGAQLS